MERQFTSYKSYPDFFKEIVDLKTYCLFREAKIYELHMLMEAKGWEFYEAEESRIMKIFDIGSHFELSTPELFAEVVTKIYELLKSEGKLKFGRLEAKGDDHLDDEDDDQDDQSQNLDESKKDGDDSEAGAKGEPEKAIKPQNVEMHEQDNTESAQEAFVPKEVGMEIDSVSVTKRVKEKETLTPVYEVLDTTPQLLLKAGLALGEHEPIPESSQPKALDEEEVADIEANIVEISTFVEPVKEMVISMEGLSSNMGEPNTSVTGKIVGIEKTLREMKEAHDSNLVKVERKALTEHLDIERKALEAERDSMKAQVEEAKTLMMAYRESLKDQEEKPRKP
ncbi:hypothetical protein ACS0TY_004133 [Phlomoides rotata]